MTIVLLHTWCILLKAESITNLSVQGDGRLGAAAPSHDSVQRAEEPDRREAAELQVRRQYLMRERATTLDKQLR
jgi:hypothetical protein